MQTSLLTLLIITQIRQNQMVKRCIGRKCKQFETYLQSV